MCYYTFNGYAVEYIQFVKTVDESDSKNDNDGQKEHIDDKNPHFIVDGIGTLVFSFFSSLSFIFTRDAILSFYLFYSLFSPHGNICLERFIYNLGFLLLQ